MEFSYNKEKDFTDGGKQFGNDLSQFANDAALLKKVRTGKGDADLYSNKFDYIRLKALFGGIEQEADFYQVSKDSTPEIAAKGPIGTNNIVGARAVNNFWNIKQSRNPDIEDKTYFGFEEKIHDAYEKLLSD